MSRRYRDSGALDCKVYVGDLPSEASRNEVEDAFSHYGYLKNVWVARNPPGFAFVEFEDPRDARDAVRELDGGHLCGRRVRVEMSNGKSRRGGGGGGGYGGRRPSSRDMRNEKCYECGETGHFARDCSRSRRKYSGGGGGYGGSRRRGRSYSRSRSRSRSRSPQKRYSRSRSRSISGGGSGDRD